MDPLTVSVLPAPRETPLHRVGTAWIKAESFQHAGSAKYRFVHARVSRAFERGELHPGTTLVEVSSGSTGVALAWAGARLGLPVEIHTYPLLTAAKFNEMERLGARIVMHAPTRPVSSIVGDIAAKVRSGWYWHLGQYHRSSLIEAYRGLADEILLQLAKEQAPSLDIFVCPVGTGGLIQGVGTALRAAYPNISILAVEPLPDARIDGIRNTGAHHSGAEDPYDRSFPDDVVHVQAPGSRSVVGGSLLGESASAAYAVAGMQAGRHALVIAPD